MATAFRNVTATAADPVATWPTEAVRAAIERGDLRDWRRLIAAVRADPWGRVARKIEEVLSHSRPYGVAELLEAGLADARMVAEAEERALVAAELRSLIAASGLTQGLFASRMGTSAPRLSSYVNGSVTPSAALLVRARRVADLR